VRGRLNCRGSLDRTGRRRRYRGRRGRQTCGATRRAAGDTGNKLAVILPGIEAISNQQIDELVVAYNETS
jgi:hypothetical protein